LFNSKLLNFVFSKFSTNSNVNGYEVDNLPVCLYDEKSAQIINIVNYTLISKKNNINTSLLESVIDSMVYELYFPDEIKSADTEVLKHLTNLPELKDDWSDKKNSKLLKKFIRNFPIRFIRLVLQWRGRRRWRKSGLL